MASSSVRSRSSAIAAGWLHLAEEEHLPVVLVRDEDDVVGTNRDVLRHVPLLEQSGEVDDRQLAVPHQVRAAQERAVGEPSGHGHQLDERRRAAQGVEPGVAHLPEGVDALAPVLGDAHEHLGLPHEGRQAAAQRLAQLEQREPACRHLAHEVVENVTRRADRDGGLELRVAEERDLHGVARPQAIVPGFSAWRDSAIERLPAS